MKRLDSNAWILIAAIALFILGAILMGVSGDALSFLQRCCF